jgi:hypothetical protein
MRRSRFSSIQLLCFTAMFFLSAFTLRAAVVILGNHTENSVAYTILHPDGSRQSSTLAAGEQATVPAEAEIAIAFEAGKSVRKYKLPANSIHFFVEKENSFDLKTYEIPLPPSEEGLPPPKPRIIAHTKLKVPVKILADSAQPAVQKIWEREFRQRIADASELLDRHCGATLEVAAVGTWQSDNSITEFPLSMREFESKVKPSPAALAIGFTSQYHKPDGQTHLGGTRGPQHPYLLVREWSQHVSKNERLEVVTHELGHYFGAVHSGEADSLMRPKLGDRLSNQVAFRLGFDPLNALAMNVFVDELRAGPYRGMNRFPLDARRQLLRIYYALGRELPKDPAAPQYIAMLDLSVQKRPMPVVEKTTLADATKAVVRAIVEGSKMNRLSLRVYAGDDLTEFYVRRAADKAAQLPPDVAKDAFLLGLGIGLNDAAWVRDVPNFGPICRQIESDDDFAKRVKALGETMFRGRHDLALHFAISAALTAHLGPNAAEKAGLLKELSDAEGESGFSFIDLAADLSGIAFAEAVKSDKISLRKLADSFPSKKFLPEIDGLKENIPLKDFVENFGSFDDDRFKAEFDKLKTRIRKLPGLQAETKSKK